MALSGTLTNNFKTGYSIKIVWTATQDIDNNSSEVTAKFYLVSLGSSYSISSSTSKTLKIAIDGLTYTHSVNVSLSGNETKLLATSKKIVNHEGDGSKDFSLSGYLDIEVTLNGTFISRATISHTMQTLNNIPRTSSIATFNDFFIGNSMYIAISRASGSFTHNFYMKAGSTTIASWSTKIATSTTLTLNNTEQNRIYELIPNLTSIQVTLYCQTWNGSKFIGVSSKTVTASVHSSIVPTFTSISHSDYYSNIATKFGEYIQTKSKLNISIVGPSGVRYSTIKSYKISFEGVNYNSSGVTTQNIKGSGSLTIKATITDSRNRTATKSITINVTPYENPKITYISITRCDSNGDDEYLGTYAKVRIKGSYTSLGGVNTDSLKISSAERGVTTLELKNNSNVIPSFDVTYIVGTYAIEKSYNFEIRLGDYFTSTLSFQALSTAISALSLAKEGIGVGKIWQQGGLDVKGEIYQDGYKLIETGSNSNGEYLRFSNGIQICFGSVTASIPANDGTEVDWTYPAGFINYPKVIALSEYNSYLANSLSDLLLRVPYQTYARFRQNNDYSSALSITINAVAIGRWK